MSRSAALDLPVTDGDITAIRIGIRAAELRAVGGWSVPALAGRVGVAEHVVTSIEEGLRLPTIELLHRLAAGLRVPPGDLLPSSDVRPRIEVHLPITDCPGSSTAQIIGGGPGNPTQTYLFELAAGEGDGGFDRHPGTELLVVMAGEVVHSALGRDDEVVRAGGSVVIDTAVPHGVRAGDGSAARFLLVCTDAPDVEAEPAR